MKAYPVLGVAIIAILIGGGLYYYQGQKGQIAYAPEPTEAAPQPQNVNFRVIDTGVLAANETASKNFAAYDEASLIKLWALAHGTDKTMPPAVNFANEYVIGVFAGQKPTGGYSVAVSSVTDQGTTRTVAVTLTKPGQGCITNQMVTSPYQIIAVPRSDNTLAHTDNETSTPCK